MCYNFSMQINFGAYAGKRICVALSGGRDSMALLHCLHARAGEFGITLSALNCNHKIRGATSDRDSEFVYNVCKSLDIPLLRFVRGENSGKSEQEARAFRVSCYKQAMLPERLWDDKKPKPSLAFRTCWDGADAVATAHHMDDNAETVLFNLARGSSLSGLRGITDVAYPDGLVLIRPLIGTTRAEIDAYVAGNCIKYVDDETNFTDEYTRNRLRSQVIPALESAVGGAVSSIYRFSRQAAEDEDYFARLIDELGLIKPDILGVKAGFCTERVVFRRAIKKSLSEFGHVKDFTLSHADALYALQSAEVGKRYSFLHFTAFKETDGVAICDNCDLQPLTDSVRLVDYMGENSENFCKINLKIRETGDFSGEKRAGERVLRLDLDSLPKDAEIRFMRAGDAFEKFGGGTKKLGDYFTDKKIALRLRGRVPLIASGNKILAVCGVEISDAVKITDRTKRTGVIVCCDFAAGR